MKSDRKKDVLRAESYSYLKETVKEILCHNINENVYAPKFAGKDMRSFLKNWDEIRREYEELGLEPPKLEDFEIDDDESFDADGEVGDQEWEANREAIPFKPVRR